MAFRDPGLVAAVCRKTGNEEDPGALHLKSPILQYHLVTLLGLGFQVSGFGIAISPYYFIRFRVSGFGFRVSDLRNPDMGVYENKGPEYRPPKE